jgi:hypothetical protein
MPAVLAPPATTAEASIVLRDALDDADLFREMKYDREHAEFYSPPVRIEDADRLMAEPRRASWGLTRLRT